MNASYKTLKGILAAYMKTCAVTRRVTGAFPLREGPKIIAPNHAYATDAFHLPFVFCEQLHFVMQKSFFSNPLFAWLFSKAGQIKVDRENGGQAFKQACEVLKRGETVVIFPEGKLVSPGERARARTGAIRMALATGVPIIPLGMYTSPQNVTNVSLEWHGRSRSGAWQVRGECSLNFGTPWTPQPSDIHALTDELMNRIYSLVNEIRKELPCASPILRNPTLQW